MRKIISDLWTSEPAATTVEYAVLLSLLAAGLGAGTFALSSHVRGSLVSGAAGAATPKGTVGDGLTANDSANSPGDRNSGGGSPAGETGFGHHGSTGNHDVVFADSFNGPESRSRWDFNGSWWKIGNGVLQAGPVCGWNELRSYAEGSSFEDGTVSLDATLHDGWGYGVFFHVSGDTANGKPFDGYTFQYDRGYGSGAFLVRKWINGVEMNQPLAAEFPLSSYQWHGVSRHIEVTTIGPMITAKVDGKAVLTCKDHSFRKGGMGIRLWNNADARFDNLRVSRAADTGDAKPGTGGDGNADSTKQSDQTAAESKKSDTKTDRKTDAKSEKSSDTAAAAKSAAKSEKAGNPQAETKTEGNPEKSSDTLPARRQP